MMYHTITRLLEMPGMIDPNTHYMPDVRSPNSLKRGYRTVGTISGIRIRMSWDGFDGKAYGIRSNEIVFESIYHLNEEYDAIVQSTVWADKDIRGTDIAQTFVWEHLYPMTERIMSDDYHTPAGKRLWMKLIHTAFSKGYRVTLCNLDSGDTEITSDSSPELSQAWGDDTGYNTHILISAT